MVSRRKQFEGGLIGGVSIPDVNQSQFDAQKNAMTNLNSRLESIKQFAMKQGIYEAERRAEKYVAGNAPDLSLYKNSGIEERRKLEESGYFDGIITDKTYSLYDRAVREHQINSIKSSMESIAVSNFENINAMAELGIINGEVADPGTIAKMLESAVNGYSDSVKSVDPAAGMDIKSSLSTLADGYYSKYLTTYIAEQARQKDAELATAIENSYKFIPNMFNQFGATSPFDNENGEYATTYSFLMNEKKDEKRTQLVAAAISAEDLASWESTWDDQVNKAAVAYGSSLLKDPKAANNRGQLSRIALGLSRKTFSNNAAFKTLYESLSSKPDLQTQMIKDVRTWATNSIDDLDEQERLADLVQNENLSDVASELRIAISNENSGEVERIESILLSGKDMDEGILFDVTNPELKTQIEGLLKEITERGSEKVFTFDQDYQNNALARVAVGDLTIEEITDNSDKLDSTTYNSLLVKASANADAMLSSSISFLKVANGVTDIVVTTDGKTVVAQQYLDQYTDLIDYYNENKKTLTSTMLLDKAKELVEKSPVVDNTDIVGDQLKNDLVRYFEKDRRLFSLRNIIKKEDGYMDNMTFADNILNNLDLRLTLYELLKYTDGSETYRDYDAADLMQTLFLMGGIDKNNYNRR